MRTGGKPSKLPAALILDKFCATVTIRIESRKVMHVETETRRTWQYQALPDETDQDGFKVAHSN